MGISPQKLVVLHGGGINGLEGSAGGACELLLLVVHECDTLLSSKVSKIRDIHIRASIPSIMAQVHARHHFTHPICVSLVVTLLLLMHPPHISLKPVKLVTHPKDT